MRGLIDVWMMEPDIIQAFVGWVECASTKPNRKSFAAHDIRRTRIPLDRPPPLLVRLYLSRFSLPEFGEFFKRTGNDLQLLI